MTIEIVIDKIRTFNNHDEKWIYYTVKILHKDMEMINSKISKNSFSGAFDTYFRLPNCIRESIKKDEIIVIETEEADFGKFIIFPSHTISFYNQSTNYIDSNLFNFGYWVSEREYCKEVYSGNENGKIMFTLEVEDEILLKFADEIEAEYKRVESEAIPI